MTSETVTPINLPVASAEVPLGLAVISEVTGWTIDLISYHPDQAEQHPQDIYKS